MTAADPPGTSTPHASSNDRSSPITIALIVWLLIQLAPIALAAAGAGLFANFPEPPQSVAVHAMLIAQFVGSAMFISLLFRGGWRTWLAMVVTTGPMLMVAAWLARMPMSAAMLPWGEVALWLTMLAMWRAVVTQQDGGGPKDQELQSRGSSSALAALALLVSAGGLLWWYLRVEARTDSGLNLLSCFPLACALHHLGGPFNFAPLLSTSALCTGALGILARKASLSRTRRRAGSRIDYPSTQ